MMKSLLIPSLAVAKIPTSRMADLAMVWRGSVRVSISSAERTLVDGARNPHWVGGTRSLADMLTSYSERPEANEDALTQELGRHGNGAAAKRIGFIAEARWSEATALIAKCREMKTSGTIKLDPNVRATHTMDTQWGIWKNVGIAMST